MTFIPTPEQEEILRIGRDTESNMIVRAYAGTGKTTTLELLSKVLPSTTNGLFLAFNVRIKEELAKRVAPNFAVMTLNGLGHRAWAAVSQGRLILDDKKIGVLTSAACKKYELRSKETWALLRDLVNSAMVNGLVPKDFTYAKTVVPDTYDNWRAFADDGCENNEIDIAREILTESIGQALAGRICFADQLYMPVCFGGSFPGYNLVMVDEAQDLSPLNHIMVRKTARKRLIVIGDERQAIYAWRGADHQSIENIKKLRPDWVELPLHTTFRCPQIAVQRAREHAPGFTAGPANLPGTITRLPEKGNAWGWAEVAAISKSDDIAVICRNNAPLLSMAFKLLRQRIGVKMLGRDIGKGLVAQARKLLPLPNIPAAECSALIKNWMEKEMQFAGMNQDEVKMERIADKGECLLAVLDAQPANAGELIAMLEALFQRDDGQVTLSSGHRAKGLEWQTVVHLDPWRIPSKWAVSESAKLQEKNLLYVIETRMKEHLILATVDRFV